MSAKLPPGGVLDAVPGKDLGAHGQEQHAPELPSLVDQLPVGQVPRFHPAVRCQDDERAAAGPTAEPAEVVHERSRQESDIFRGLRQEEFDVHEAALRDGVLPRRGAGEEDLWGPGVEYPLWVQRERFRDFGEPITGQYR